MPDPLSFRVDRLDPEQLQRLDIGPEALRLLSGGAQLPGSCPDRRCIGRAAGSGMSLDLIVELVLQDGAALRPRLTRPTLTGAQRQDEAACRYHETNDAPAPLPWLMCDLGHRKARELTCHCRSKG